jgi:hypothetical protein
VAECAPPTRIRIRQPKFDGTPGTRFRRKQPLTGQSYLPTTRIENESGNIGPRAGPRPPRPCGGAPPAGGVATKRAGGESQPRHTCSSRRKMRDTSLRRRRCSFLQIRGALPGKLHSLGQSGAAAFGRQPHVLVFARHWSATDPHTEIPFLSKLSAFLNKSGARAHRVPSRERGWYGFAGTRSKPRGKFE